MIDRQMAVLALAAALACGPGTALAAPAEAPPRPAVCPPVADAASDWELPGSFGATTTREELERTYGPDSVHDLEIAASNGAFYHMLTLFPDDPTRRLQFAVGPDWRVASISLENAETRWHVGGLRPGISLAELVACNGAPLTFAGFGTLGSSYLENWNGGRFAAAPGAPYRLLVRLAPRPGAGDAVPTNDAPLRSDDPAHPGLGDAVVVEALILRFP
ncbi:hypothetical protein [Thermomonas sp.]|uniref:hypothetical protein n=1 Tax=Thermomonas sp. TaxID=1971895 RepID=UPI002603E6E0|nr:hypothetical protein [Thermomonas sp.]